VVVVDEAGMVGSRHLAHISDLVEAASGKLILIGDHRQLAEIDAGGLFATLTSRLPAVELTENVRQHHEWERDALSELRDGSVARAVAMYDRRGLINLTADAADAIAQAVDAWYRDAQSMGALSEVLLIADRNDTVHRLNRRARAVVGDDGRLTGPALAVEDREFQAGDRVVCLKNRARLGVLNGDLGTVTSVDADRRTFTLSLDRTQQHVTIPAWYLDERNIDWGYAITGHKAQGATARRVHTVVSNQVDREWFYVTMSRGRDANTIYLPDVAVTDDDCQHVAHDAPNRVAALVAALGGTSGEPAAHDTGRGPANASDEQLIRTLMDLGSCLNSADDVPIEGEPQYGTLVAYTRLAMEAKARHQDRLATTAFEPPSWILGAIGERPADPEKRAAWDRIVDCSMRYRGRLRIPEEAEGLIGPMPEGRLVGSRIEWLACHRHLQGDLRVLEDPVARRGWALI
jgi:hypothetical protein